MLCRLTPPMCLNFLGLIHLDSHITKEDNIEETSYTKVKLTPYCEWIKIMNLKSVKSLDFVTSFPLFLIEHCKNREKKMILSMFKWKPLAFFFQIMGHMDVISFISDGFNIYFPIILVLLCICTFFSLGSRILHFLGVQQFIGDDDMTQELVDEGRQIVQRGNWLINKNSLLL